MGIEMGLHDEVGDAEPPHLVPDRGDRHDQRQQARAAVVEGLPHLGAVGGVEVALEAAGQAPSWLVWRPRVARTLRPFVRRAPYASSFSPPSGRPAPATRRPSRW